ncbi:VWA domain-containing protein [Luminiphilus sp.]|nr:VWA domain-containing protein [Luminiphilus sp.]
MKRRLRDQDEVFGMSFLDVISCGFAAMVAILMLAKQQPESVVVEPELPAESTTIIDNSSLLRIANLRKKIDVETSRSRDLQGRESLLEQELRGLEDEVLRLRSESPVESENGSTGTMDSPYDGGIPVDATHVVFVIDSSGSMKANWGQVTSKVKQLLSIHPQVKAMQVLSDMGDSLIPGYDKKWIPDTPSARKNFNQSLANMSGFSNSSPVEGIERALRIYAPKAENLAIYVLGDDFTGGDFESVLASIDRLNTRGAARVARIHAIGFPWGQGDRFATLMREVAYRNNGVYLGL